MDIVFNKPGILLDQTKFSKYVIARRLSRRSNLLLSEKMPPPVGSPSLSQFNSSTEILCREVYLEELKGPSE
jgi:hypothetical protein